MSDTWEYGDAAPTPSERVFPWPPGADRSIPGAFAATWKAATFDAAAFFPRVPRNDGTGAAILYYLVIGMVVAGANLFWDSLATFAGRAVGGGLASELGMEPLAPLVSFLFAPALLMGMLLAAAAITHMLLSLFDGVQHGFGTTLRVFCYAYSPVLFGVVPAIGGIVGSVWMLVLLIIGLREAHETEGWKTAVAVLLPFFLLLGLVVFSMVMVMAAGAALM